LYPVSGSGSKLFEPRLGRLRLRLSVFEPVDNITYSKCFNILAKTINDGLLTKYHQNKYFVTVGYSMNFYNTDNWSSLSRAVLYRLEWLHFFVVEFENRDCVCHACREDFSPY